MAGRSYQRLVNITIYAAKTVMMLSTMRFNEVTAMLNGSM